MIPHQHDRVEGEQQRRHLDAKSRSRRAALVFVLALAIALALPVLLSPSAGFRRTDGRWDRGRDDAR